MHGFADDDDTDANRREVDRSPAARPFVDGRCRSDRQAALVSQAPVNNIDPCLRLLRRRSQSSSLTVRIDFLPWFLPSSTICPSPHPHSVPATFQSPPCQRQHAQLVPGFRKELACERKQSEATAATSGEKYTTLMRVRQIFKRIHIYKTYVDMHEPRFRF